MATGQTLLDTMELLNQELQLQSGEEDVTRGLVALNRAQDYLESIIAAEPDCFADTTGTVATVNATETTTFPSGVLRIDTLQKIGTDNLPEYDLDPIRGAGRHVYARSWPFALLSGTISGAPRAYWTNGRSIYWDPIPDNAYTIRWYGLQSASDITAVGTFGYPDAVILPLAAFAVRLMKIGVDDDVNDVATLAENTFRPVIRVLPNFNRDGARPLRFRYQHSE